MDSRPSFSKRLPVVSTATRMGFSFIVALAALLVPEYAHAQAAASAGDLFCNAYNNIGPFIDVFNWIAYTIGAFIGANGVYLLARHNEAPGQVPMHQPMARLLGATFLLALPSLAGMVIDTFFLTTGPGGLTTCAPGPAAQAADNVTLDVMMTNMIANIKEPLISLLSIVCDVFGVFLMMRGAFKASKYGTDPRVYSITNILSSMIFGSIFMVIGSSLDTMMGTVFGDTTIHKFTDLSWTAIDSLGGDMTQFKAAIQAALTFFQLVGFIAFIRGWNVLKNSVEGNGQATFAQGLTHIIGGVLAINIYYFMQIMDKTFGTNFVS